MAIAIGDAVGNSTISTLLYVDASGNLANSSSLSFNGTTFTVSCPLATSGNIGLFGTTPAARFNVGGNLVAGPTYGLNEQRMLQDIWTYLKALGVLS